MTTLKVDDGVLLFGLRVNMKERWAALFFGKWAVVVCGTGEGK